MSSVVLGKVSELEIDNVSFTGRLSGTDSLSFSGPQDVRAVPGGRGVAASQLGGHRTNQAQLSTDSNSVHDPVLQDSLGQVKTLKWYPKGQKNGNPLYTSKGVLAPTLTMNLAENSMRWSVAIQIDGDPVKTTV